MKDSQEAKVREMEKEHRKWRTDTVPVVSDIIPHKAKNVINGNNKRIWIHGYK